MMFKATLILLALSWVCSVGAFALGSSKNSLSIRQSFDAIIWDCDGVLVDSEALLKKGEVDALKLLGHDLSVADCTRLFSGVSPDKAMENFKAEFKQDLPKTFFKEQIEGSTGDATEDGETNDGERDGVGRVAAKLGAADVKDDRKRV